MFRNSLRRSAASARLAVTASVIPQTRTTLSIASRRITPLAPSIISLNRIASIARAYSSESQAVEAESSALAQTETVGNKQTESVRFSDLDNVHRNLLAAISGGMGYSEMTPVQAKTIKPALKGTDIVAQAKTGTGKTIAFLLPVLQRMINDDPDLASKSARIDARSNDIRGIVLSPTRELAEQIAVEARRLVKNTGLVVQVAVGGTDKRSMLRKTRLQGCHLLVATPGRLNDLLSDPESGIDAPRLAALVLDEADRMLDVGFEKELREIMRRLPDPSDRTRQTMLVSATIPDNVIRLARTMVRPHDFEFVQTIPENESLTHDKVPQYMVPVTNWSNVFPSLFELIDREVEKSRSNPDARPFKAIVYFNTTAMVDLAGEMGFERRRSLYQRGAGGISTFFIQSKLSQNQRQMAADKFRTVKEGVLFSSDVTARGMDFPDVTHVIQMDMPRDRESYIHRLGRTGRQNKEGEGWLIIPHLNISASRKMLRGLPITQDNSLESAEIDLEAGETTPAHDLTRDLFAVMPRPLLSSAYYSMFGHCLDKYEQAEEANFWAMKCWGWDEPPHVSSKWAGLMGLRGAPGMNISDAKPMRSGNPGLRRPPVRSRFAEPEDPFDNMRRGVVRDNRNRGSSRNGFDDFEDSRGGSRGNFRGGSRGGYRGGSQGGYGRGRDRDQDGW